MVWLCGRAGAHWMSDENAIGMSVDARWQGETSADLRHLAEAVRDVRQEVAALRTEVVAWQAAHDRYHQTHESRWGPVRWAERHPVRFAVVVAAVVLLLSRAQVAALAADFDILRKVFLP